ncbi:hypothetical protein HY312_02855 [Candidatus Saccharibacteria bacterium]|nr:hypothetical protein [Candidatus Saccharibacteria bacterium]
MVKKNTRKKAAHVDSKRTQRIILGAVAVAAIGAIAVMVIVIPSKTNPQGGVGANGFSVFEKRGADLGVANVTSKNVVADALGKNAKNVADVEKSGVISINGNVGQTATYGFTLTNNEKATIDVDVLQYKSKEAYDADGVFKSTGLAGTIDGREVRYLPAVSIGKERIYALLVTKDLKSYKFAMAQPNTKVQIKEYLAQDILKAIIDKSNL